MMNFFSHFGTILARLGGEPDAVRRRWALALIVGSLPIVLGLWWLTLQFSFAGATPATLSRAAAGRAAGVWTGISRGVSNVASSVRILRGEIGSLTDELAGALTTESESEEPPAPASAPAPAPEPEPEQRTFPLPIVE